MVGWKETVTVKSRLYLSMQHIQSAALFARRSGQIEKEYDGNFSNELLTEYRADITASIFTAVSFLEATINELFADATEEYSEYPESLNSNTKALMADMWKMRIPRTARYPILEKFDIALILARKPTFDAGKSPAQDVDLIVKLRNYLVHYETEWMSDETTASSMAATEKRLSKHLRGKFSTSPLMGRNNPFFPNKCLSYGCALWAVGSSLAYSDEFYKKLGVPAPYEHIRQCLRTI